MRPCICCQVMKFHTATQKVESHFVGAHRFIGEPIFVPDRTVADAAEDSGWLLSIVHDGKAEQTELHVFNAQVRARVGVCMCVCVCVWGGVGLGFRG